MIVGIIVEVCCGCYEDAKTAKNGGADRIELNCALSLGGLTPSIGTLKKVKNEVGIKTIAMVRPRAGGFCYTDDEYNVILTDVEELLKNGADGIAFGFLKQARVIDEERTKAVAEIIHRYGKEAVFHRAFDCVENIDNAINSLIKLKIDRVLTSGNEADAYAGQIGLKHLMEKYSKHIEILAGAGVNENNVLDIIKNTGVVQVHSSCKAYNTDPTTKNHKVSYAYMGGENEMNYEVASLERVKRLVSIVKDNRAFK